MNDASGGEPRRDAADENDTDGAEFQQAWEPAPPAATAPRDDGSEDDGYEPV
jgi:hypothetical protein